MKLIHTFFSLFLPFLLVPFLSEELYAQQTATDFFKISSKALEHKQYDIAITFADTALKLNPKYGSAYWNRAMAHDYKGMYRKAINDYDSAIAMFDNNVDLSKLHKNRGAVYNTLKIYDSALADFNIAISKKTDFTYAYWSRATAFEGLKKYDSAINNYTWTLKYMQPWGDRSLMFILRGVDYLKLGKKIQADSDFHSAIILSPSAGYNSAYATFLLGEKQKAVDILELYLQKAKSTGKPEAMKDVYFEVASVYSLMNDENNAITNLFNAINSDFNDCLYLSSDKDFDNIRDSSNFKGIIALCNKRKNK